ncbi:heme-binding protein [Sphingobium aromaticivastans]|uniref:heme-binding protein n=1 Tax=Sphingobium aromaticivastans TaxID=1778665 RepID=UPI00301A5E1C
MSEITWAQAKAIVAAAIEAAAAKGIAGASVVVADPAGAIRAAERTDAAGPFGIDIARAKARTALGFRRSSIKTAAIFGDKPAVVTGLNAAIDGAFLPLGGGVVVVDGAGSIVGAAALAGGMPEADHEVIANAVVRAGLAILD